MEWLKEFAETGSIPDRKVYTTNRVSENVAVARNVLEAEMVADRSRIDKGKSVDKGKGKAIPIELDGAKEMDIEKMQDITNSECLVNCHVPYHDFMIPGVAAPEQHPKSHPMKPGMALERQRTAILPDSKPPEKKGSMFGLPNETLSGSSSSQLEGHRLDVTLRTPTISPNLSMAVLHDGAGTRPGSFTMSSGVQQESTSQSSSQPQARIPSSTSPSPMKPPSFQMAGSSRQSSSPAKIDHEATKALQDSITSLLGKRPSPDVEELAGVNTAGRARNSRPGKRPRPQRSKVILFFSPSRIRFDE
jgi:hypothetical protein